MLSVSFYTYGDKKRLDTPHLRRALDRLSELYLQELLAS